MSTQPREGPFHRPPARQDAPEAFRTQGFPVDHLTGDHPHAARLRWVADDLDRPAQLLLDPRLTGAGVALIDPDVLQSWELLGGAVQEQRDGGPILQRRRMHLGAQD